MPVRFYKFQPGPAGPEKNVKVLRSETARKKYFLAARSLKISQEIQKISVNHVKIQRKFFISKINNGNEFYDLSIAFKSYSLLK